MTVRPTVHQPIMLKEMGEGLLPARDRGEWLLDATFGGGGHARWFLERGCRVLGLDQDGLAIERGHQAFASEIAAGQLQLQRARMSEAAELLRGRSLWGVVADLGFSSDQMDDASRGLSFKSPGPLDMRMDVRRERSARALLEWGTEEELADIFYTLGEERHSRRIARNLVERRDRGQLPQDTGELAQWIQSWTGPRGASKIHPATRVFQAMRMWVNDEMGELDALCARVLPLVPSGGRVGILTFHSLEDRVVKRTLLARDEWTKLTKKPRVASDEEVERNPRSRSAKLRLAERV